MLGERVTDYSNLLYSPLLSSTLLYSPLLYVILLYSTLLSCTLFYLVALVDTAFSWNIRFFFTSKYWNFIFFIILGKLDAVGICSPYHELQSTVIWFGYHNTQKRRRRYVRAILSWSYENYFYLSISLSIYLSIYLLLSPSFTLTHLLSLFYSLALSIYHISRSLTFGQRYEYLYRMKK